MDYGYMDEGEEFKPSDSVFTSDDMAMDTDPAQEMATEQTSLFDAAFGGGGVEREVPSGKFASPDSQPARVEVDRAPDGQFVSPDREPAFEDDDTLFEF